MLVGFISRSVRVRQVRTFSNKVPTKYGSLPKALEHNVDGIQPREAAPQRYNKTQTIIQTKKWGEEPSHPVVDLSGTKAYEEERKGFLIIEDLKQQKYPTKDETAQAITTAMTHLQEALLSDPHLIQVPHIHYGLGLCHMFRHQWKEAQEQHQLALDSEPDFVPAYESMGEVTQMQGDTGLALGWYTKFLDTFIEYYSSFGEYSKTDLPGDIVMGQVLFKRGMCYFNMGDYQMASGDWNSLIELDHPLSYMAFGWLSEIALIHKKWHSAVSLATKALERNPDYMKAYQSREQAYTFLNKPEEAEEDRRMFSLLKRKRTWQDMSQKTNSQQNTKQSLLE